MKVAVLLIGNVRDWEICKPSFKESLGEFDLFVSTYDLRYNYHPMNKSRMNDFENEIISQDYLSNSFVDLNLKAFEIENHSEVERSISEEKNKFHPIFNGLEISFAQYRKLKKAIKLMTEYELQNNFKYDIIIRTRFDIINYYPMDIHVREKQFIYNESSEEYVRNSELLPDHIFLCNRDDMINVTEFMYNEFFNPVYDNSSESPPHGLLRNAIKFNGLNKTTRKLSKNILRKNGELLDL